jgi:hypothetical protein
MDEPTAPKLDPKKAVDSQMGIAYDLMNLGVMDIGASSIEWTTPLTFVHPSNQAGARVEGTLSVDDDGKPSRVNLKITSNETDYHYEVRYGFSTKKEPLEWFPRQIEIVLLRSGRETVISDYQIQEIHLAETVPDQMTTDFEALTHLTGQRFIFTDGKYHAVMQLHPKKEPTLIPFGY